MSVKVRKENDVCILSVEGKLTIGESSAELRETIRELSEAGCRNFLINLEKTSLMDSIGVGALVSAYTTVTNKGGQMKLVHLGKRVHRLLSVTKLLTVFDSFEDEKEAVKSYRSKES